MFTKPNGCGNTYGIFIHWDSPCKVEQPLQGMELQEKEAQKDTRNLLRKNLQLKGFG